MNLRTIIPAIPGAGRDDPDRLPIIAAYGKWTLKARHCAETHRETDRMTSKPPPATPGGLYFEDFTPERCFRHGLTCTVTQMDNMLFSNMTLEPAAPRYRRAFLRDRDPMGQAADELCSRSA